MNLVFLYIHYVLAQNRIFVINDIRIIDYKFSKTRQTITPSKTVTDPKRSHSTFTVTDFFHILIKKK